MKVICMECQKILNEGPESPVSHGLCLECTPGFLRRGGLDEKGIAEFMEEWKKRGAKSFAAEGGKTSKRRLSAEDAKNMQRKSVESRKRKKLNN